MMLNVMNQGWCCLIWGIIGQQIVLVVYVVIVVVGVGFLVVQLLFVFNVICYVGVVYFVYFGIRFIFIKLSMFVEDVLMLVDMCEGCWLMICCGFWVNFFNFKVIVFFFVFIFQFICLD